MTTADDKTNGVTQNSSEFFEAIGSKASKVGGTATETSTAQDDSAADDRVVEEIESLCMNCGENGATRLLLTSIPYFREIIIMSFSCDKCGFHNNEVQPAGSVQPKGVHYELRLTDMADFARQVVKADTATVKFIELDLEVPAGRGQLTNVEGLLSTIVDDLSAGQEERKEQAPEIHEKLAEVIDKGKQMLDGAAFPFRIAIDDPAGNSFIAPDLTDGVGKWAKREFTRTPAQNDALGLRADSAAQQPDPATPDADIVPNEVYSFPATCPGCTHPCTTHMKMVDIPHFKQVVLMSTVCDACGYRSNDVKTGGAIPARGERIALAVRHPRDLARDILKSESCTLSCPELSLLVNPGTLGGRFTTVEGLFTQVRNDLHSHIFEADGGAPGGAGGDSMTEGERSKWADFFAGLDAAIRGEKQFTVVLTDPLASSYVQPLVEPPQPDPQITKEEYTRTDEEEEELGLKDIKVEGYEEDGVVDKDETAGT